MVARWRRDGDEMADVDISRHDDHLVFEISGADQAVAGDRVVVSMVVRTKDDSTVALHRDGSLMRVDDSVIVVGVSGVDPMSIVSVNESDYAADHTGRVIVEIDNTAELTVAVVNQQQNHEIGVVTQSLSVGQHMLYAPVGVITTLLIAVGVAIVLPSSPRTARAARVGKTARTGNSAHGVGQ